MSLLRVIFEASPFLRWTLVPIAAWCAILLPFWIVRWDLRQAILVGSIEAGLILFALAVGWPRRFRWAGRAVCGGVFAIYLVYLADELIRRPEGLEPHGERSEASAWNGLLGLVFIGLPCLWYAMRGRFTFGRPREADSGAIPKGDLPESPEIAEWDEPH